MLSIDDNLRQIYKNESLPYVNVLADKQVTLYFPELDLTVNNDKIVSDSFSLTESLCSDTDLTFGACESAWIKITVADIEQDVKGKIMVVTQTVNGTYTMPLGTYIVDSAKKQADLRFKDIVAHDQMQKFDVDVSTWYNGLTFPITLKNFRLSLCSRIGVSIIEQTLPNDNMLVTKTVTPTVLSGRDVLKKIAEINGTFGHITRDNKLKFIGLSAIGLYPSETLYPAENLFPSENSEYLGAAGYKDSRYEEYEVKSIDKLQIREQEGDIGVTVGMGTNGYIIEGNFLVFGKTSSELTSIASNLLLMIKDKKYRPHKTNIVGLPYIEVGDAISIVTNTDVLETFVLKRTLTGIQALNDEISAAGSEHREQDFGISSKLEQLQSRAVKIKADVDGLDVQINGKGGLSSRITANESEISSEVTRAQGAESSLSSQITQTASEISAEVTRAQGQEVELAAAISVTAGQVSSKVSKGSVISEINQSAEQVKINANLINLNGYVSANDGFWITINGVAGANVFWISELKSNVNDGASPMFADFLNCGALTVNGDGVLTVSDASNFASSTHTHSGYASYSHSHWTDEDIIGTYAASSTENNDLVRLSNSYGSDMLATGAFVTTKIANASDSRLKKDIKNLESIKERYMQLVPVQYKFKEEARYGKKQECFGFIAQDVADVFEEDLYDLVNVNNSEITDEERALCPTGIYEINYNNLHALHTQMIQTHENEINMLKIENNELKDRITKLEELVNTLIGGESVG